MKRGVTLIELLVAISLMGMVSLGLLFGLRIATSAWQKGNTRLAAGRQVIAAADLFAEQIANARPRMIEWGPRDRAVRFFYFEGAQDRLRFLTATSLAGRSRSGLWLVEYSFRRDEGGRAKLVYNEWPFSVDADAAQMVQNISMDPSRNRMVIRFNPPASTPQTRDLYRDLEDCGFEYLILRPGEEPRWEPQWETTRPLLPPAVATRFRAREGRGIAPVAMVASFNVREVLP